MNLKNALDQKIHHKTTENPGWWDQDLSNQGWTLSSWNITDLEKEVDTEDSYAAVVLGQCWVDFIISHSRHQPKEIEKILHFSGMLTTHTGGLYEIDSVELPAEIDPDEEWS